jgi:hypothetical protein
MEAVSADVSIPTREVDQQVLKLHWYSDASTHVYSHRASAKLFHEVGFFDSALNGNFAESKGTVNIYHPSVTRDNVVSWLKFRQWVSSGFVGDDPRTAVSPWLLVLAEYLMDVQFTMRVFRGAVIYPTLIDTRVEAMVSPYAEFAGQDLGDDTYLDPPITYRTHIMMNPLLPITVSAGFYSREDILYIIVREINVRYQQEYQRDLVYIDDSGSITAKICQPEYTDSQWDHGRNTRVGFPLTRTIVFECRDIGKPCIAWSLLQDSHEETLKLLSDRSTGSKIITDARNGEYVTKMSPRRSICYVLNEYDSWNVSDGAIKILPDINFSRDVVERFSRCDYRNGMKFDSMTVTPRDCDMVLRGIQSIDLKCSVRFGPILVLDTNAHPPPLMKDFPYGVSDTIIERTCTDFIYSFANNTPGIGMEKLRKFALCDNRIALAVWEIDPMAVCTVLNMPMKSRGSASKKKFSELADHTTSILRTKYGFTDLYEFDDPELKRLQAEVSSLRKLLQPFQRLLSKCGDVTLDKISAVYEDCEIDSPADLKSRLMRAENAYEERYSELVKRAKKAEQKSDHSRYDYLCRK